jgi:hypothetical protein
MEKESRALEALVAAAIMRGEKNLVEVSYPPFLVLRDLFPPRSAFSYLSENSYLKSESSSLAHRTLDHRTVSYD